MNNIAFNLHTTRGVRIQRRCLNGTWQLQITADLEDDAQARFTLFAETREALDVALLDDEHCRITGGESTVEYSDKPFSAESSADRGEPR